MSDYRRINLSKKILGNLKWILLSTTVILVTFIIIFTHNQKEINFYENDGDKSITEIYEYVTKRWYNFEKNDKWYNTVNNSMFDEQLAQEIRENWIIKAQIVNKTLTSDINDNSNNIYSGLKNPEVEDPSMGQAEVIREIFNNKMNGFFIECGAYDGETRSNTLNLERFYNWTGILIEADPLNFSKMLLKNRRAYLSPTCLSIQRRPMNTSFLMANNIGRIYNPTFDSIEMKNSADIAYKGTRIDVQCFPLASYIAAINIKIIDYLSLDVEGNELDILETIPFDNVDIKTLSVEYTHVDKGREHMIKFMDDHGYYVYTFVNKPNNLANDIIFVKR